MHLPSREPTFAVAAARDLHNGIQRPQRAPHGWEIHVNAGFDQLRGNDAARLVRLEVLTDFMNGVEPVLRAHGGGEVNGFIDVGQAPSQFLPKLGGMAREVYDAERLLASSQFSGKFWPIKCLTGRGKVVVHSAQVTEQRWRIRRKLPKFFSGKEIRWQRTTAPERWLCCGTEDEAHSVVPLQFTEDAECGCEQMSRQCLHFVKYDHRVRDTV